MRLGKGVHHLGPGMLTIVFGSNDLCGAEFEIYFLKQSFNDDHDMNFAARLLEKEFLVRAGNFQAAGSLIDDALAEFDEHKQHDIYQQIRLLTEKAALFAKARRPQKGFSLAMRAIVAARRSGNDYALWEAMLVHIDILCALGEYEAAVERVMGTISEVRRGL